MWIFTQLKDVKILSLCFLLLTMFFSGCGKMQVNNNKFLSSRMPYFEVNISPSFKYLSHFEWENQAQSVNKTRYFRYKHDSFFFVPNDTIKGSISKYVYIRIVENTEGTIAPVLFTEDSYFDKDIEKMGWKNFQIASQFAVPMDIQTQKLIEEGLKRPDCVLRRLAGRLVSQNKYIIYVSYEEDATLSGYACEKWKDRSRFTDEQKKYITDFNKRALSNFEIIASD